MWDMGGYTYLCLDQDIIKSVKPFTLTQTMLTLNLRHIHISVVSLTDIESTP
jgi:hypothetical protein